MMWCGIFCVILSCFVVVGVVGFVVFENWFFIVIEDYFFYEMVKFENGLCGFDYEVVMEVFCWMGYIVDI